MIPNIVFDEVTNMNLYTLNSIHGLVRNLCFIMHVLLPVLMISSCLEVNDTSIAPSPIVTMDGCASPSTCQHNNKDI